MKGWIEKGVIDDRLCYRVTDKGLGCQEDAHLTC